MDQAKAKAVSFVRETQETVQNAGKYHLDILSGAHEGTCVKLEPGEVTIGAAASNSIVLFADKISDQHIRVDLPKSPLKSIQLAPMQDKVFLDNGSVVEIGQYAEINSGDHFVCGDVEMRLERIADPRSIGRVGLRAFAVVCLIAMLPLAYSLLSTFAVGVADASSSVVSAVQSGISDQKEKLLGLEPTSSKGQLDSFAWTARTKLEDLKLNHKIRVTPTSTGSLRVYGNVSDQELARWTNFLQWYDSNAAFPPLIRDVNRQSISKDLPKISTVWLDNNPSVVFSDGVVAEVGSQLRDGWRIVAIEAQAVTIERDGVVISLTY